MKYDALIAAITSVHEISRAHAVGAVNRHHVLRNWVIGAYVVEFEQEGEDRARYGSTLLKRLSADLCSKEVPGTSVDQLERMRALYFTYPQIAAGVGEEAGQYQQIRLALRPATQISASVTRKSSRQQKSATSETSAPVTRKSAGASAPPPLPLERLLRLSWTHLAELVRLTDPWKRAFYENECLKASWSVRQLQRQIGSLLYERTGLSTDKHAVIARGRSQAAEAPLSMGDLIRDPYILEFTGLAVQRNYEESALEKSLLDHLQAFLLELGVGFCFEARQKRITVGNEHDYIDLVFYHRALRCHLLIDLKVRGFRHGDAGQMNFYLNYWKANMMLEGDNPPVGLLLCADKDHTRVEYATGGLPHELMVSRYLVALPKPKELQALLEHEQALRAQRNVPCSGKRSSPKP